MRELKIGLGAILSFFLSCDAGVKWQEVAIPVKIEVESMLFDDSVYLIAGSKTEDWSRYGKDVDLILSGMKAIIYRSTDNGSDWEEVYSGNGEIRSVSQGSQKTVYAAGRRYSGFGKWSTFIIESMDAGKSWRETSASYNRYHEIEMRKGKYWYAWTSENIDYSEDHGLTWERTNAKYRIMKNSASPKGDDSGRLWYIRDRSIVSQLGNEYKVIPISDNYSVVEILPCYPEGKILFVARKTNSAELDLFVVNDMKSEIISHMGVNYLVLDLFCDQSSMFMVAADMSKIPPRKTVSVSYDSGRTWKASEITEMGKISTAYYDNGKHLYVGGGNTIIRSNQKMVH